MRIRESKGQGSVIITMLLLLLAGAALPALGAPPREEREGWASREPGRGRGSLCAPLIRDFKSSNPAVADRAYRRLYAAGSLCVGELLKLSGEQADFAGTAYEDPLTCNVFMKGVTTGVTVNRIALYLVDAILLGTPTPHYSTTLRSFPKEPADHVLERAYEVYQQWWAEHEGMPLGKMRKEAHPLDGTGMTWHGFIRPEDSRVPISRDNGTPKPGSETPRTDPAECIAQQNPYSWILVPGNPGGPTPYNCMAWAVNCFTDRWMQPNPDAGTGWMDILEENGYDTSGTIDCVTQSCANGGTKIKMVFEVCPGEGPTDDNWVHAMKQEAGGDWTSKNGAGPLYEGIKDCQKFINDHYPPAPGKSLVAQCYCPKAVSSD